MPLLNAAIVSHSPILIPEIGKINRNVLKKTVEAYEEIAAELQGNDIETIIIISPHGKNISDYFIVNLGPELKVDLSDFGFLGANKKFTSNLSFIDQLRNKEDLKIKILNSPKLDYGASIPLYLLSSKMPDVKVVVINYSEKLNLAEHLNLGQKISEIINDSAQRIAVIASGDLSHRLKKSSPEGYSPKGAKFDSKLIEFLNEPETCETNVLGLDEKTIKDASECGLKSIVTLLGVLSDRKYEPEVLAYQTDFGIGYLTMNFKLE